MKCSAGQRCLRPENEDDLEEQYDRYGIHAGRWHDQCWREYGYAGYVHDEGYAGERLEEEDLKPQKVIDSTQAWFWMPSWSEGEAEADSDIAEGRVTRFTSDAAFLADAGERLEEEDW